MQSRHFHERKGLARFGLEVVMILSLSLGSFSPVFAQNEVTPEASETPTEISTEVTPTQTATEVPTEVPTVVDTPTPEATATETATETPTEETSTAEATEELTPTAEPTLSAEQLAQYFTLEKIDIKNGKELNKIQIHGPSKPIPGFTIQSTDVLPLSAITINNVPTFSWVLGCSAVSGSMIAGYYDRTGYSNMYTGATNGGVMPLTDSSWGTWTDSIGGEYPNNPLIGSHNGLDGLTTNGSIDDYWSYLNSEDQDPYITGGWNQHAWGSAIGDFMKTSQSTYDNTDGSTSFYLPDGPSKYTCDQMKEDGISDYDGTYGRKEFYEARGYTVTDCYTQYTDNYEPGGFSFNNYMAEINSGNPVMINVEGHTMVGYGYDSATKTIYIKNTWASDELGSDVMTWGDSYEGMELWGVSIVHVSKLPLAPTLISPSAVFTDTMPTYEWNEVPFVTSYKLKVTNEANSAIVVNATVNSSACEDGICSFTPTNSLASGIYNFQVASINSNGTGAFSSPMEFQNVPPANDLISKPRQMTLGTTINQNTYLATVNSSSDGAALADPVNVCNTGDTGSVWYKFTAPSTGIFTLNAFGSDYKPNLTVLKLVSSTSRSIVDCGETGVKDATADYYKLSFNATSGSTYLIGASDWVGGGKLSLKVTKETCAANQLCAVVVNGDGSVSHSPYMNIFTPDGSMVGADYDEVGNYSGFVSEGLMFGSAGNYTVMGVGSNSFILNNNVKFPGYTALSAVGYPETDIIVKDTSGKQIATDHVALTLESNIAISGSLDGTKEDAPLTLFASNGLYKLSAAADEGNLIIYQPDVLLSSSTPPASLVLDASVLPHDTLAIHADGITNGNVNISTPDFVYHSFALTGDRSINIAGPADSEIRVPSFSIDENKDSLYWYYYFDTSNEFNLQGGENQAISLGGTLSVNPNADGTPVRLDEGKVGFYPGVTDAYGDTAVFIHYSSYSPSGAAVSSQNEIDETNLKDQLVQSLANNRQLIRSILNDLNVSAQNYDFGFVEPTYTITDAKSNKYSPAVGNSSFNDPTYVDFASSATAGTWSVEESIDLGPFNNSGTKTGSSNFEVYAPNSHSLVNDDFDNAITLTQTSFLQTDMDTMGGTTAADDPILPKFGNQGNASVWFKYVAPSDGLLTIDTDGSDYSAILSVWTGVRGKLVNKAISDDEFCFSGKCYLLLPIKLSVTSGQTYYIEVTEYTDASSQSLDAAASSAGDIEAQAIGGKLYLEGWQVACYSLTTSSNNTGYGTVSTSTAPNCMGTKYGEGTEITLTAKAKSGYGLYTWMDGSTDNPYILDIAHDTAVRANFVALGKPTQSTPAAGYVTNEQPTLTWKAVNYADHYQVQVSKVSTFATLVEDESLDEGVLTFTTTKIAADGQYYWRVRAVAASGDAGAWSANRTFTFDTTAPLAPSLSAPVNGVTVRGTPNYTWAVPVGAKAYLFEYDNDADLASPVYTSGILAKSNVVPPLQAPGTYYWHVKAEDAAGNWSDWSSARTITINPTVPAAPKQTAPAANTFFNYGPTLTWQAVNYGDQYQVQVSRNSSFTSITQDETIDELSTSATLGTEGMYYWRVRAINVNHETSPWSSVRAFTYDVTKPAAPTLSAPLDNANVKGLPTYTWTVPTGAKTYIFEYADDVDFNNIYYTSQPLTTTKFVHPMETEGTYYWHVKAADAAGNWSNWSTSRKITIDIPVPAAPVLTGPAANAALNKDLTLTWKYVNYADYYMIQISRVATFTPANNYYTPNEILVKPASITEEGLYYWRVCAINASDETGSWSAPRTFIYDLTAPAIPTLKSPLSGTSFLTSKVPLAVNAVTGAKSYEFQVSADSGFGSTAVDEIKTSPTDTLSTPLDFGTYYWRAQSVDAAGNHSDWSSANSFDVTFLKAPLNYSTSTVNKPVFTWQAVPGALQYKVDYWWGGLESSTVRVMFTAPATSYTFPLALPNGTYQWHMKVQTASGWSEWTPTWTFTINH